MDKSRNHQQVKTMMPTIRGEAKIPISRIKHGKNQVIETLINEEAYHLAKYLRNERESWKPRIPLFSFGDYICT